MDIKYNVQTNEYEIGDSSSGKSLYLYIKDND